ncbi:MAG TPA: hypothetical protein VHW01_02450 [Polyangiaceae bacterium]|nr:hypothetical protein [Polyangiaceae bacterium]
MEPAVPVVPPLDTPALPADPALPAVWFMLVPADPTPLGALLELEQFSAKGAAPMASMNPVP